MRRGVDKRPPLLQSFGRNECTTSAVRAEDFRARSGPRPVILRRRVVPLSRTAPSSSSPPDARVRTRPADRNGFGNHSGLAGRAGHARSSGAAFPIVDVTFPETLGPRTATGDVPFDEVSHSWRHDNQVRRSLRAPLSTTKRRLRRSTAMVFGRQWTRRSSAETAGTCSAPSRRPGRGELPLCWPNRTTCRWSRRRCPRRVSRSAFGVRREISSSCREDGGAVRVETPPPGDRWRRNRNDAITKTTESRPENFRRLKPQNVQSAVRVRFTRTSRTFSASNPYFVYTLDDTTNSVVQ